MEWEILKEKIYYWDGAWLNIYVLNTTQEDWEKWVEYINNKYELSFYNGKAERKESKISFSSISAFWSGKTDLTNDVIFKLDTIKIKCHFFNDTQIENDFDPGDISSIEDHYKILNYMTDISNLLGKTVIVTPENRPDFIFISATSNGIKINV